MGTQDFLDTSTSHTCPILEWQCILGWINWGLNVFPLLHPSLQFSYEKISGKSHAHRLVYLNRWVIRDLSWVSHLMEDLDGICILESVVWGPDSADLIIFCDACPRGLGFCCPSLNLSFCSLIPDTPQLKSIFFHEAICIASALTWETSLSSYMPHHLLIYTDSMDTIEPFHTMHGKSEDYNMIVFFTVEILLWMKNLLLMPSCAPSWMSHSLFFLTWMWELFNLHSWLWGQHFYDWVSTGSQPQHVAWTLEWLVHEWAIALSHSIDSSSTLTCNTHLQSYLAFCKLHQWHIELTPETTSQASAKLWNHIFKDKQKVQLHPIITWMFSSMMKMRGNISFNCKHALTSGDVECLFDCYDTGQHNDTLFPTVTLTRFHALLQLGEMTQPNLKGKWSSKKSTLHYTPCLLQHNFSYLLLYHKGDQYFEGNIILVTAWPSIQLCLTSCGHIPTYTWYVSWLWEVLGLEVASHTEVRWHDHPCTHWHQWWPHWGSWPLGFFFLS